MDHLFCPCPAVDCKNTNKEPRFWYHANCGGKTMIRYNDITLICSLCFESAMMFDWNFSC